MKGAAVRVAKTENVSRQLHYVSSLFCHRRCFKQHLMSWTCTRSEAGARRRSQSRQPVRDTSFVGLNSQPTAQPPPPPGPPPKSPRGSGPPAPPPPPEPPVPGPRTPPEMTGITGIRAATPPRTWASREAAPAPWNVNRHRQDSRPPHRDEHRSAAAADRRYDDDQRSVHSATLTSTGDEVLDSVLADLEIDQQALRVTQPSQDA